MTKRLIIIAAVLILFQGGAFFLLQRAKSSEVRPLNGDLNAIPYRLEIEKRVEGQTVTHVWQGENSRSAGDEDIVRTVGARHAISRKYQDESGRVISVHIADWDSLKTPTLPHPPTVCYPSNGAKIIRSESVSVGGSNIESDPIDAELLVVENSQGVRSLVLYWYAWNDQICRTRWQACVARLKMIGSREWPPVVKVMLDTPAMPNEEESQAAITELATKIRELTKPL